MLIQVILTFILLILLIITCAIYFYRKKQIIYQVYTYQFNDKFDTSAKSDPLYPPFNELFDTVDEIHNANLITFTDYGDIDNNIEKINYPSKAYIYAINGSDLMANKANLAKYMNNANKYIPNTFILKDVDSLNLQKDNIYILKKNIQRQEGILITKDIDYIKQKAYKDGYIVCQELLQDPFLVNKRKINMRVYLLIVINNSKIDMYIYNDGFMYYTPKYFEKNSIEKDVNITTGYIDRQVYVDNPLTHRDLYNFLGKAKSDLLQANMITMFKEFKNVYTSDLLELNKNSKNKRFNIFGIDIAPDEKLDIKIIETNKSPDLSYKDERDGEVKLNMVKNMLSLVGILEKENNTNQSFIKI